MALGKIRQANKKARREQKRKAVRVVNTRRRAGEKIRRVRTRKMIIQGRREYLQKRKDDKAYVGQLQAELEGE